jgi:tripartite-type tricarboxylate transporter receptor subunit TctC
MMRPVVIFLSLVLACAFAGLSRAETVADFYNGKTINLLIASAPGGGVDVGGRLVARHLGKFIPGNPTLVPQNMQGGGGLRMANFLANAAERQGLTIGVHLRGAVQQAVLGDPAAKFDPQKLNWIGTTSSFKNDAYFLIVRADRGIRTVEGMRMAKRPVLLGTVGGAASNVVFALLSQELFGFNVKLIRGYKGSTGVMLSVQRKETDGTFIGLSSIRGIAGDMFKAGELLPIVQLARRDRHPDFPNVPTGRELVSNKDDLALLSFAESQFFIALPFSTAPRVPADRVAALRAAFMKANQDPGFIAEARKLGLDSSPLDGKEVSDLIRDMARTPPAVLDRYRKIVETAAEGK